MLCRTQDSFLPGTVEAEASGDFNGPSGAAAATPGDLRVGDLSIGDLVEEGTLSRLLAGDFMEAAAGETLSDFAGSWP